MKYILELTADEVKKAIREQLRSTLPHYAEPEDIYISNEYGEVYGLTAEYEHKS